MHLNPTRLFSAVVVLSLVAASAVAGPLPSDPAALPGWQGSSLFLGSNGGTTLGAAVEYAVYAPGMFSTSTALGLPADPSGGTEYVYAYEVFNGVSGGNGRMLTLTIGLIPGALATTAGHNPTTPELGLAPNLSQIIPAAGTPKTSVKWSYTTNLLNPGLHSDILLFTSPLAPHFLLSSMLGSNATGASASLPSPVPEPSTFVLAIVALAGLAVARRARK